MATFERITVSMQIELARHVRRVARAEGVPVSTLVARLVARGLPEVELAVKARNDPMTEALVAELLRPENLERAARIVGQTVGETAAQPDLFRQRAESLAKAAAPGRKGGKS